MVRNWFVCVSEFFATLTGTLLFIREEKKRLVLVGGAIAVTMAAGCRRGQTVLVMPRTVSIAIDNSGSAAGQKILGKDEAALNGLQYYSIRALETVRRLKKNEEAVLYAFTRNTEPIGPKCDRKKAQKLLQDIERSVIEPGASKQENTLIIPTLRRFGQDALAAAKEEKVWTGIIFTDGQFFDDPAAIKKATRALAGLPNVSGLAIGPVLTRGGYSDLLDRTVKRQFEDAGKKCLIYNSISDATELRAFLRETRTQAGPKVKIAPKGAEYL